MDGLSEIHINQLPVIKLRRRQVPDKRRTARLFDCGNYGSLLVKVRESQKLTFYITKNLETYPY